MRYVYLLVVLIICLLIAMIHSSRWYEFFKTSSSNVLIEYNKNLPKQRTSIGPSTSLTAAYTYYITPSNIEFKILGKTNYYLKFKGLNSSFSSIGKSGDTSATTESNVTYVVIRNESKNQFKIFCSLKFGTNATTFTSTDTTNAELTLKDAKTLYLSSYFGVYNNGQSSQTSITSKNISTNFKSLKNILTSSNVKNLPYLAIDVYNTS